MADAYGKRRQLERMEGVVRDAAAHGHVSLPLLNATLDAYGKAGLLGNLRNALQRIKSFNLAPDLTRYAPGAPRASRGLCGGEGGREWRGGCLGLCGPP